MTKMLKENLESIRVLIAEAAKKARRDPSGIMLVAVTKEADEPLIKEAIGLGIRDFGENRVQDALKKKQLFNKPDINLHFIGHLQTNKVSDAVKLSKLIHSVDSKRIIEAINKESLKIGKVQDVLLEINISGEISKFGFKAEEAEDFLNSVSTLKAVRIKGLMTMAPILENKEGARPYFRKLRELFGKLKDLKLENADFKYLSMGMSGDFEAAIEEGANIVRIGTALFK